MEPGELWPINFPITPWSIAAAVVGGGAVIIMASAGVSLGFLFTRRLIHRLAFACDLPAPGNRDQLGWALATVSRGGQFDGGVAGRIQRAAHKRAGAVVKEFGGFERARDLHARERARMTRRAEQAKVRRAVGGYGRSPGRPGGYRHRSRF